MGSPVSGKPTRVPEKPDPPEEMCSRSNVVLRVGALTRLRLSVSRLAPRFTAPVGFWKITWSDTAPPRSMLRAVGPVTAKVPLAKVRLPRVRPGASVPPAKAMLPLKPPGPVTVPPVVLVRAPLTYRKPDWELRMPALVNVGTYR